MTGILEGTKIVELGHMVAVPVAGATMADWGANVLKIEPLDGEMARGIYIMQDQEDPAADLPSNNWYFHVLNRGKKTISVDLKTEVGRNIVYKLVEEADVLTANYERSSMAALGMDYSTLQQVNPKLIYASLTGYGTEGPDKDLRGLDWTAAWARGGIMQSLAGPDGIPVASRGGMMDRVTGSHLVGGICAALYHREKTGEGQEILFSLYHTGVWSILEDVQAELVGQRLPPHDRTAPMSPTANSYCTKDGKWFWISGLGSGWKNFCEVIGRPDLVDSDLFKRYYTSDESKHALIQILDEVFASKSRAEWNDIFNRHNFLFGRAASPAEVVADEQAEANGFFADLGHPGEEMRVIASPVKFTQNPSAVKGPAPEIGQHTEEMLRELGYEWEEITALKEQGVIL